MNWTVLPQPDVGHVTPVNEPIFNSGTMLSAHWDELDSFATARCWSRYAGERTDIQQWNNAKRPLGWTGQFCLSQSG